MNRSRQVRCTGLQPTHRSRAATMHAGEPTRPKQPTHHRPPRPAGQSHRPHHARQPSWVASFVNVRAAFDAERVGVALYRSISSITWAMLLVLVVIRRPSLQTTRTPRSLVAALLAVAAPVRHGPRCTTSGARVHRVGRHRGGTGCAVNVRGTGIGFGLSSALVVQRSGSLAVDAWSFLNSSADQAAPCRATRARNVIALAALIATTHRR